MTKAEARQHFGTSYLYWHGANRCWDATPPNKAQKAQRNAAPSKRYESVPDREPVQQPQAQTSPIPRPDAHDDAAAGEPTGKRAADDVPIAEPSPTENTPTEKAVTENIFIENKAEPIASTAPIDRSANVAQVTPSTAIEGGAKPVTRSHSALLEFYLLIVMALVPVLGIIEFLFRRTYPKRVLAFGAMRRSQRRADRVGSDSPWMKDNDASHPATERVVDINSARSAQRTQKGMSVIERRFIATAIASFFVLIAATAWFMATT